MSKYILYCTTCTVNKKIYIGVHKTEDPEKFDGYLGCGVNINMPCTYRKPKTLFQKAVNKYGFKNFIREVLKVFDNSEDAYAMEEEIVNSEFVARIDTYNMVTGGSGGDRSIQAKICYQYDSEGNYLASYPSKYEAARAVHKGSTTINRAIDTKIKAGDWYWTEYKVDKLDLSEFKTTTNRIPVYQYSKTGEYDCCYESIGDAGRCYDVDHKKIEEVAKLGLLFNDKYFSFEYSDRYSDANLRYLKTLPVYVYKITGEYLKEFENIEIAKKELDIKVDLFKYVRMNTPYKEYQFSYEKLEKMPNREIKKPGKRKIAQYDLNDNLIAIYNTVAECVKIYGTGVKHCLRGRNHQSKGFKYKYIDQ